EVDLASQTISPAVLSKVPAEICRRHRLFPLAIRRDERGPFLHVAMADPADLEAIDDLRFLTGLRVEAAVAPEGEIHRAIERHYGGGDADPFDPRVREAARACASPVPLPWSPPPSRRYASIPRRLRPPARQKPPRRAGERTAPTSSLRPIRRIGRSRPWCGSSCARGSWRRASSSRRSCARSTGSCAARNG